MKLAILLVFLTTLTIVSSAGDGNKKRKQLDKGKEKVTEVSKSRSLPGGRKTRTGIIIDVDDSNKASDLVGDRPSVDVQDFIQKEFYPDVLFPLDATLPYEYTMQVLSENPHVPFVECSKKGFDEAVKLRVLRAFMMKCQKDYHEPIIKRKLYRLDFLGQAIKIWMNVLTEYLEEHIDGIDEILNAEDVHKLEDLDTKLKKTFTVHIDKHVELLEPHELISTYLHRAYHLGDGICNFVFHFPFNDFAHYFDYLTKKENRSIYLNSLRANFLFETKYPSQFLIYLIQKMCDKLFEHPVNEIMYNFDKFPCSDERSNYVSTRSASLQYSISTKKSCTWKEVYEIKRLFYEQGVLKREGIMEFENVVIATVRKFISYCDIANRKKMFYRHAKDDILFMQNIYKFFRRRVENMFENIRTDNFRLADFMNVRSDAIYKEKLVSWILFSKEIKTKKINFYANGSIHCPTILGNANKLLRRENFFKIIQFYETLFSIENFKFLDHSSASLKFYFLFKLCENIQLMPFS